MLKLCFAVLVFILPVAAKAGSTETVSVPDHYRQQQQRPIIIYGNTAVLQGSQDNNSVGLRQDTPAGLKKDAGPESKKKKKNRLRVKPGGKKGTETPAKKKLVPVHFEDKTGSYRPCNRCWALGKIFEIIDGFRTMRPRPCSPPLKIQNSDKPKD